MQKQFRQSDSSSAERRVLWEVRQRYHLAPPLGRRPSLTTPPPPRRPRPLGQRPSGQPKRPHRPHIMHRAMLIFVLAIVLSGGIFGYKILAAGNKVSVAERSLLGQLKDLLFNYGQQLQGESDDRVNILLLAIGGEGHSGENLADTVMVASLKPQTKEVALLSIPRDLYVQVPGEEYYSKINAVHAYGESKKPDFGPELIRQVVEDITGLPIHYYARIDFIAFKHIVDAVGGINVAIEKSFFDYLHKISFPEGTEKMNGERALAYVRARYVEGPEGGDFKRAARQQQVLLALRDKVFSVQTAFDFGAINSILNSLSNDIRTDMQLWEMKRFYELARSVDVANAKSVVLSTGRNGLLTGGTEVLGGAPASVLRPRTGDYSEIHQLAQNIFASDIGSRQTAPSPTPPIDQPTPEPTPEAEPLPAALVEVRNGTNVTGLASRTSRSLEQEGYKILAIGNAANRATVTTTVYALATERTDDAKTIADILGAQADSGLPGGEAASLADILVILGTDAAD